MWRPSRVERSTAVFVGLIVLSLMLITVDLRASGAGLGGILRDGVQAAFTPVQKAAAFVTRPVVGFFEGISDMVGLRDENRRLRLQVADLERRLAETESLQRRVEELEAILAVEPPGELDAVVARVLATGPSDFEGIRLIDKGRRQGITVDMPVIDEGGLVGRVVAVTATTARLRLITHPTMRVAVRVERTGETGILTGRGGGPMQLEMFNTNAALVQGDLLVTADGRFPAGIPVARVAEAARAEVGFSLRTTATPEAELSRVDYVKVLVFTSDRGGSSEEEGEEPIEPPRETTTTTGSGPGTTLTP
ncbi:MAG: rod shape-determining protein MreC [Actinobacteria bacterium]|nr:rod shape-determining protein MreC [Actinomycetota bacterium]